MSTVNVADLTRLAQVNSAKLIVSSILINPAILEVVAQRSGFNWDLKLQPGIPEIAPIEVEYYPYLVLETKIGPDWPPNAGIGPVVLPTTLHNVVTYVGTKGIEVIGRDFRQTFDYQRVTLHQEQAA